MELYIKKLCRVILSVTLLGAMHFSAHSQQLDSTLSRLGRFYQPEKAYLHYDKSSYLPGETIWYKVYLMEGLFPAQESKNMYIDWISDNGEVLAHYASPLVDGISIGQFDLPENYKGNHVHVRAYTRWMLNFDSSVIYQHQLRVHPKTAVARQPLPDALPVMSFFPEGGELVAGILNRVAFKVTDQWGRPVRARGTVIEKNSFVDSLRTVHDGMGAFTFIPKAGTEYLAKWKDESGKERTTPLPAVKNSGVTMQVSAGGENKKLIQVYISPEAQVSKREYNIVGTLQGNMVFKTTGSANTGGSFRKIISTANIPTGILTITLFDADWNAIAERISFINNNDYSFQTGFEVIRWGLNKRAKNEIEISLPDSIQGSFSVSVTDAGIDFDSSQNIISQFLLSSELKGKVNNPAYYFKNNSETVQQHLDLVMMTNGWRRYKWEEVTKGKLPEIRYPRDTAYLSLSGKLFGAPKSQLTGAESIVLMIKSRDSVFSTQIMSINKDGSFGNPDFLFFDTLRVYYQVKSKLFSNSGASFMPGKLAAPSYEKEIKRLMKLYPVNYDTTNAYHAKLGKESLRLQQILSGNVMETVTVTAKAKTTIQEMEDKYANGLFRNSDGYQFDLVHDPLAMGRLDIFNYLQGKVAGLQIFTGGEGPQVSWRGSTPEFFLDERIVDADLLQNIPIDDIAYVKVFRPPFVGASFGGAGGAIAVYTKKGSDQKRSSGGLSSNTITGFAPLKEFYSPNYSTIDKRHETKDLRTTLYWNGMLTPSAGLNKLKFSFYNNDVTKAFRVIVEGITKEGLLMHMEEVME